jgi:hypothetical protein
MHHRIEILPNLNVFFLIIKNSERLIEASLNKNINNISILTIIMFKLYCTVIIVTIQKESKLK